MSALLEDRNKATLLPFGRRGKTATQAVKQAARWESTVNGLWHSGRSADVYRFLADIAASAEAARVDGDAKLAARLLTTTARTMHTLGEISAAEDLLRKAMHSVDYIGEDTLNNISRLRVRIALDQGRVDDAIGEVAKIDRPIINRSATLVTEHVGGGVKTRLDTTEAGDVVRENEGEQSSTTALLQAEVLFVAGDTEGARKACDHARRMLLKLLPENRDLDDVAMLSLLRQLDTQLPNAGDPETLADLARMSSDQQPSVSAAVIARYHAAAGRLEPNAAINHHERERYQKLGREARAHARKPSEPRPTARAAEPPTQTAPAETATSVIELPAPTQASPPEVPAGTTGEGELQFSAMQELAAILHVTHTATTELPTHDVEESKRLLESTPVREEEVIDLLDSTLREGGVEAEAHVAPAQAPADPNKFITTKIYGGIRRESLYSVIEFAESRGYTGYIEIKAEGFTPRVYFSQGRVAHAVHPAHEDDAGAAFIEITDMANVEGFEAEVVGHLLDSLDRVDLLHKFSSNVSLMLWTANRGLTPEEAPGPEPDINFGESVPATILHAIPPVEVITAGDALLNSDNMTDLVARLAEHCTHLGAKDVRVAVILGKDQTLVSHPAQQDDTERELLLEAKTPGSRLRLTIEASEPPAEEDKLRAISLLGRSARFQAVTLPLKGREEARASALRATSSEFVWTSNVMFNVTTSIQQIAPADGIKIPKANILLRGDTGTGKEKAAELIHRLSNRHGQPFVKVNMAAISTSVAESELFGHNRGAFTGADRERVGLIESAHGGTILLDEVGDCPPDIQTKLLRAMGEGEIIRMGESRARKVDVRWILSTDQDTSRESSFRQQLVHRCQAKIDLPPLSARREDIALLARHFALKNKATITDAAVSYLEKLDYPGNVRDLGNAVQMAALAALDNGGVITPEHAQSGYLTATKSADADQSRNEIVFTGLVEGKTVKQQVEEFEALLLQAAVNKYGSASQAIPHTGLSRNTLYRRLSQYGIKEESTQNESSPS